MWIVPESDVLYVLDLAVSRDFSRGSGDRPDEAVQWLDPDRAHFRDVFTLWPELHPHDLSAERNGGRSGLRYLVGSRDSGCGDAGGGLLSRTGECTEGRRSRAD